MVSEISVQVRTIRHWLAGTYSNRQQAMAEPVWFIPVTLWYVPVDGLFPEGVGFFTEQVNEHTPDQPYRTRVLRLMENPLRFENYRLQDQAAWAGASKDPERLSSLTSEHLELLSGCTIYLEQKDNRYLGTMKEGQGCRLSPDSTSCIQIEFELTDTAFITLDRGFDLTTNAQVWGSKGGPYHYLKQVLL
jgi:CpeT protein